MRDYVPLDDGLDPTGHVAGPASPAADQAHLFTWPPTEVRPAHGETERERGCRLPSGFVRWQPQRRPHCHCMV